VKVEVNQEIVTGGKRRLDVAIAARGTDEAFLALLGRKFEVLTRVRRAYYELLGGRVAVRVNEEVVAGLEEGLEITRRQVEQARTRPRTDLLRLAALLEEARIRLAGSRVNLEAAWQQLAAEVGVARLQPLAAPADFVEPVPEWELETVTRRVQEVNTELARARLQVGRARLEVERARAEAVPNVTVGGGYSHDFAEKLQGAIVSLETPLPLWDRKQGRVQEARARWAQAQAAGHAVAARLSRDTAAAFARYRTARQQAERLAAAVLPQLWETVELLRKSYRAGSAQTTFADVLTAEQALGAARQDLAAARQALWLAVADLQGLMQLEIGEEPGRPAPPARPCPAGPQAR
jgi:cobalt-zinc-cadmium efflux system outer membrane protein